MNDFSFTCRPIVAFPVPETPAAMRRRAQFKTASRAVDNGAGGTTWIAGRPTPIGRTLEELKKELGYLEARDVVLQLDLRERDLRNDGWPRSDARPATPRVVLAFQSKHGPLQYPCDTFDRWEDNVRAIRLALEALRAVDRYGVTKRGEQFQGWKALPASTAPTMSAETAAQVLSRESTGGPTPDAILHDPEHFRRAHRAARAVTHPDRNDGDRTRWDQVEAAAAVLATLHRITL